MKSRLIGEGAVAKADLGGAYIVEGNPEAAIEVLQQAVELDRRNWSAWSCFPR